MPVIHCDTNNCRNETTHFCMLSSPHLRSSRKFKKVPEILKFAKVRKHSNVKLRQSESPSKHHSVLASLWQIYSSLSSSRRLQCTLTMSLIIAHASLLRFFAYMKSYADQFRSRDPAEINCDNILILVTSYIKISVVN